jgi:hypothetical protein
LDTDNFYQETARYPKVVKAIIDSFITFTSKTLYPELFEKDPLLAMRKFIPTDIDAGGSFALREATRSYDQINFPFPFSIFNFDTFETRTGINQIASRGEIYSEILSRKIATYPCKMRIKVVSFFTNPDDYMRANTYLNSLNISLNRLYAGLKFEEFINNQKKIVGIPYDINLEFEKGSYVNKFQEYLNTNNIYDIVFNANILYWDFFGSDILKNLEVNELIINVNEGNISHSENLETFRIPYSTDEPVITTSIDDQLQELPYKTSKIVFTFDKAMDELAVESDLYIQPSINYLVNWDETSSIMELTFLEFFL